MVCETIIAECTCMLKGANACLCNGILLCPIAIVCSHGYLYELPSLCDVITN